eukprot:4099237-Amphidinium_carterae.1
MLQLHQVQLNESGLRLASSSWAARPPSSYTHSYSSHASRPLVHAEPQQRREGGASRGMGPVKCCWAASRYAKAPVAEPAWARLHTHTPVGF